MNPYKHAEISVKNWGGKIEDYYPIHQFMDCTKEVCSDNRHRILHTHWGIFRVINPIFGEVISNSDGKLVNVKDLCERDHVLPDFKNKFIPTLADFVACIDEQEIGNWKQKIEILHQKYAGNKQVEELLLSPLHLTGQLKSLLLTHNSWFLNYILPKILPIETRLLDFEISAHEIFQAMRFELWMDNGTIFPPSANKLNQIKTL
jgi:hypothetical protein